MLHIRYTTQLSILAATCVLASLALAEDETPAAPEPAQTQFELPKDLMHLDDMIKLGDEISKSLEHGASPLLKRSESDKGESELFMYRVMLILLFSVFGLAFFVYGRKQSRAGILLVGILLMIFPYFVSNIWALAAIGTLLMFVPLIIRKYGPGT